MQLMIGKFAALEYAHLGLSQNALLCDEKSAIMELRGENLEGTELLLVYVLRLKAN